MGAIRSLPENHVNTLTEDHDWFYFSTGSCCGWQYIMQDFELSLADGPTKFFAVIDGHNGPEVAQFCHLRLPQLFSKNQLIKMGQLLLGMESMLSELDEAILHSSQQINKIRAEHSLPVLPAGELTRAGCALVIVLFTQQEVIIANIGQCKCYVMYKEDRSKAILFSGNHTLSNKEEEARILKSNGFCFNDRINGIYPYTRSIGDLHMKLSEVEKDSNKGVILSEPSVFSLRRQDIYQILLGSSGVWEKPETIAKIIPELGKGSSEDRDKLETLISDLIAKQPEQERIGLENMTLTSICFLP